MDLDTALDFVRHNRRAVLATQRRNGRPQLSSVTPQVSGDGLVRVSITANRAKYKNLVREPWAALHVSSADFWTWVALEGPVELSDVAQHEDDDVVAELVDYYRSVSGEHPDWDEYRRVMVADQRVVMRLRPERAYGQLTP